MRVRWRMSVVPVVLAMCASLLLGVGTPANSATAPPDPSQPIPECTLQYTAYPGNPAPVATYASCQKMADLTPLLAFPTLTSLLVNYYDYQAPGVPVITDFSPLAKLPQLSWVAMAGVTTEGLKAIAALPLLSHILAKGNFSDLTPLAGSKLLTSVSLRSDGITTLDPLATVPTLRSITVASSRLFSTAGLRDMPALQALWLEVGTDTAPQRARAGVVAELPIFTGPDGVTAPASAPYQGQLAPSGGVVFSQSGVQSVQWQRSGFITLPAAGAVSYSLQAVKNFDVLSALSDTGFNRIYGPDRFTTSVSISQSAYPGTAPVAYLASGTNFSDALSAGPAAATEGGPLLLTAPTVLPSAVKAELQRLHPAKVVIVGGPASVSAGVFNLVRQMVPNTVRRGGVDRYEVSRAVAAGTRWKSSTAYVASGLVFPDALSAASLAGSQGSPVVLVRGTAPAVDIPTKALMSSLGIQKTIIAGGPATVSLGIEKSLSSFQAVRVGGVDRYAVNRALNSGLVKSASSAYFASGEIYTDALAGSAIAGSQHAVLYLVRKGCMPRGAYLDLSNSFVNRFTTLGGPGSVSFAVDIPTLCG
jgi:hypothetical protein